LETRIAGKDDYFRAKGVVVETLPNATFRVKLETGHEVTARASGKMRKGRMIRIIPGDSVEVDVSAYDPTMGRIVWRYR
jgi:translation initiation factor IF-1